MQNLTILTISTERNKEMKRVHLDQKNELNLFNNPTSLLSI